MVLYMSKTTVGIAVYNEINYIKKTLASVAGQADEIIISDNASTDGTSEICQRFASAYSNVKYVRFEENKGAIVNFLNALHMASGDYFMWLGGHDMIGENHVAKLQKALDDNKDAVLAYSNVILLTHDYVPFKVHKYAYAEDLMTDKPESRMLSLLRKWDEAAIVQGLFRKDILLKSIEDHDRCNPFENLYLMDVPFVVAAVLHGKFVLVDDLFYFKMHPKRKTNDHDRKSYGIRITKNMNPWRDESDINPYESDLGLIVTIYGLAAELEAAGKVDHTYLNDVMQAVSRFYYPVKERTTTEKMHIKPEKRAITEAILKALNQHVTVWHGLDAKAPSEN